jgi:hypothetical protein
MRFWHAHSGELHERERADSAHEHVAESPVGAGSRERSTVRERPRAERPPLSRRFRWALVALIVVGVGSIGAAIAMTGTGRHVTRSAGDWSAWQPPDNGLAGAQDIADFLAPLYRATPASQLSVITAVNLDNPSDPVQVAIPGASGALLPLSPSGTIVYNMCGVGSTNCSIGVGTASSNRLLLLRREGLELALYTFKYISGVNTVIAILPPGHTVIGCSGICAKPQEKTKVEPLNIALAFDKQELQPYLSAPLSEVLPEQIPPTVSQMPSAPEAGLVSIITARGLFSETTQQAQDGSTVLELTPMRPQ